MSLSVEEIPDVPSNIYARSLLLNSGAIVRGNAIIRHADGPVAAIFGTPSAEQIKAALDECRWPLELVGPLDAAEQMERASGRRGVRSTVFVAPADWRPGPSRLSVLADNPAVWAPPMGPLIAQKRIATAKLNDDVAGVCIAAFATEKYWDVAVETPVNYRRRGFATDAFNLLAATQLEQGRRPVWGAPANNPASTAMAKKLGLVPTGEIFYVA